MPRMMAVVKAVPQPGLAIIEKDVPVPAEREVLLRVRATSICGTDLHIWQWDDWSARTIRPPITIGHEFFGEVAEVGPSVSRARPGDPASVESHIPCGECRQCREDRRHICEKLKIFGIDRDGSFAEYVTVPEVCLWIHRRPVAPELGSILEPLGNAVHAVSEAEVRGMRCLVLGCGPIGQFTVQVARAMGATEVAASDIDPGRLEMARESGADPVFPAGEERPEWERRFDVVFEMSGSTHAFASGVRMLRRGGTLVAFGLFKSRLSVDVTGEFILAGRRLIGIVGRRMYQTWETMQRLLDEKRIEPEKAITHRLPLAEFRKAFEILLAKSGRSGKIVLLPPRA